MSTDTWAELRRLNREMGEMRRELIKRPIQVRGVGSPVRILQIVGGNTLSDGSTAGIKYAASTPANVPSLYNPAVDTSFITGVGRAILFLNGASQGYVLVANYSGNGSPWVLSLVNGQLPLAGPIVTLTLAGDATKSVQLYTPYSP